jgi:hypothetical protein
MILTTLIATHFVIQSGQSSHEPLGAPLPRRGAIGLGFAPLPPAEAQKLKLKAGTGLIISRVVPGFTGDLAGVRAGDIILNINGKALGVPEIAEFARNLPSGKEVNFRIVRDGKEVDLKTVHKEKERDLGTADYEVIYSHIVSYGKRMRTIITKPRKAGKHPGFFFIQGFSPISYDYVLDRPQYDITRIDAPMLADIAKSGYVTMRVEKPGVGDSEGGPFADLDYNTEIDIYRQALKQLKAQPKVDNDNVFICGHSMGGAFGPMIACEIPVKGISVYGTAARTWLEYLLDTVRYQGLLSGDSFEQADESVRLASRMMAMIILENMTPAEVKKKHPELAKEVDGMFPGGMFNGKTTKFWAQLGQINFPAYWAKCNARVLSVRGESDYVTYDADHKLIADVVNRVHPGWARFEIAKSSDHLFNDWPTEADSMKNWTKGNFNMNFTNMTKAWMKEVMAQR